MCRLLLHNAHLTVRLQPTSVTRLQPPLAAPVCLPSGLMHPSGFSGSLGNFSGKLPDATLGITVGNFHCETNKQTKKKRCHQESGMIPTEQLWVYCRYRIFNLCWIRWGFPPLQSPAKLYIPPTVHYRWLVVTTSFFPVTVLHCFPQGIEWCRQSVWTEASFKNTLLLLMFTVHFVLHEGKRVETWPCWDFSPLLLPDTQFETQWLVMTLENMIRLWFCWLSGISTWITTRRTWQ